MSHLGLTIQTRDSRKGLEWPYRKQKKKDIKPNSKTTKCWMIKLIKK